MEDLMGIATASKKEERFFSGLVPMMSAVFFFIAFSFFMLGVLMLGPKKVSSSDRSTGPVEPENRV